MFLIKIAIKIKVFRQRKIKMKKCLLRSAMVIVQNMYLFLTTTIKLMNGLWQLLKCFTINEMKKKRYVSF
ncbi:hypothetical protein ACH3XW_8200 [Acanthocheilonema viteae]